MLQQEHQQQPDCDGVKDDANIDDSSVHAGSDDNGGSRGSSYDKPISVRAVSFMDEHPATTESKPVQGRTTKIPSRVLRKVESNAIQMDKSSNAKPTAPLQSQSHSQPSDHVDREDEERSPQTSRNDTAPSNVQHTDEPKAKKRRTPAPKPGLWRSSHISPYNADAVDAQSADQTKTKGMRKFVLKHGIRIPYEGWFGIGFGLGVQGNQDLIQDGDYDLYMVYPKDDTTKRIALPLKHKAAPKQGHKKNAGADSANDANDEKSFDKLTNVNVGKLFYLSRGTIVLVAHNRKSHEGKSENDADDVNTDTNVDMEQGNPIRHTRQMRQQLLSQQLVHLVKWCVVAAHHSRKGAKGASNNTARPATAAADGQIRKQQQQQPKKSADSLGAPMESKIGAMNATHVICSTCIRTFRSSTAVICHHRSQHFHSQLPPGPAKAIKSTTMWSTPLQIVHQDPHMAIVIKPQGMVVQGESPSLYRSNLLMALKDTAIPSHKGDRRKGTPCATIDDDDHVLTKPVPCHRLDSPTGGLLVIAKTKMAERNLKLAFAEKKCHKRYRALVTGKVEPKNGECTDGMGGKTAHTKYSVVRYSRSSDRTMVQSDGWITVMDLFPITGRKHQLRKHMKKMGHPIWGDVRYGHYTQHPIADPLAQTSDPNKNPHARLCLWAVEITLPHPKTGEDMTFRMDGEPSWLGQVVSTQGAAWSRKQLEDR